MKKRVILTVAITLLVLLVFSMPALAAVYKYTGTSFRYIGDIFHEKEIKFDGGSVSFQVRGKGMAQGSHDVRTEKDSWTIQSPVDSVYDETFSQKKVNVTTRFTGATDPTARADEKVRLISQIALPNKATVNTGVEMNPGESGYINQDAASSHGAEGSYLKVDNHFGNTGGITRRVIEVKGFINESMNVDGYAEVWESTEVRSGNAKTGWWDIQP